MRVQVIKIQSDLGGLEKKGQAQAPDAIISAMYDIYLNEDGKFIEFGIDDVEVIDHDIDKTNANIYDKIKKISRSQYCIILGGDHSITYSSFKAFAENNTGAGIIVFDAHPDCENTFSPPSHEDYLRVLIEEGIVDASKVIIIGIRNWHSNEHNYLREKKIKYFTMKEIFERGISEICDSIMFVARQWPALYLSIDIDSIDPGFAPGTGYREPG